MHHGTNRQQRRCLMTARFLIVVVAAALLITMIPRGGAFAAGNANGQASNAAVSQGIGDVIVDDQSTPEPTWEPGDLVDATAEPTETPTENPDDLTDATMTPTGTPENPDDVTTEPENPGIAINKWVCPAGFQPAQSDPATIAMTCTDSMVVHFSIFTHYDGNTMEYDSASLLLSEPEFVGETDIRETIPTGMYDPWVTCYDVDSMIAVYNDVAFGGFVPLQIAAGQFIACDFYNLPMEETGTGTIEIHKWACPDGFMAGSWDEYLAACTATMNGVPFHAASNGNDLPAMTTGDSGDGTVVWTDLDEGPVVVQEEIPSGYGDPIVFCRFTGTLTNDAGQMAVVDGFIPQSAVVAGVLSHDLLPDGYLYCDWFNIPTDDDGYGSITIYKHTCPAGYDVNAYGANPWLDCPELTNGVNFTLTHGADVPLQTMTGDSIDGAVYWGGLMAGDYAIQETVPADTAYAFVLGCSSDAAQSLAPTDLIGIEFDSAFLVDLAQGEDLVCHWYNVPALHGGTVVITKYWCDDSVYSVVACDRYEQGASFDVTDAWGNTFQVTTGIDGTVSVTADAGSYTLDEVGGSWCHAEASKVDAAGNIVVEDGGTTTVTVFNCGPREVPQGKPTPGKFPNTGIGPIASEQPAA